MFKNQYRYAKTLVLGNDLLSDTGNKYRLVSQRAYKGNTEKNIPAGVTVTLQIIEDNSEPIVDKATGMAADNNVFETFEATILNTEFPLPYKKGDYVALEDFKEEYSYYINYNLILRFGGIKLLKAVNQPMKGGN